MSTPKRLLYVITKSNFGGAQRYVYELACAYKARGYEVAVAAGGDGELFQRLHDAGIKTYPIAGAQRDINWKRELAVLTSLRSIISDFSPEIIHLNSSKIGGLGSLMARLMGVPFIVFTAHGWPFHEPRSRQWRAMAWLGSYLTSLLAHQIIVVSAFDYTHAKLLGTKHKQTIVRNALVPFSLIPRTEARTQLYTAEIITRHEHDVWLVTHGEINHNKNHTTAIDAVAEFNSTHPSKIFYTIIGAGELITSLKEQVSLRGMDDYILFIDHQPDVRSLLLAFDLYLMPSYKEGLPYSLLEAGFAGLPVIASRVGGIPEIITNQEQGLLIDPHTHTGIVDALALLINEPEKRFTYTSALTKRIATDFAPEAMLAATSRVYELGSK